MFYLRSDRLLIFLSYHKEMSICKYIIFIFKRYNGQCIYLTLINQKVLAICVDKTNTEQEQEQGTNFTSPTFQFFKKFWIHHISEGRV